MLYNLSLLPPEQWESDFSILVKFKGEDCARLDFNYDDGVQLKLEYDGYAPCTDLQIILAVTKFIDENMNHTHEIPADLFVNEEGDYLDFDVEI